MCGLIPCISILMVFIFLVFPKKGDLGMRVQVLPFPLSWFAAKYSSRTIHFHLQEHDTDPKITFADVLTQLKCHFS